MRLGFDKYRNTSAFRGNKDRPLVANYEKRADLYKYRCEARHAAVTASDTQ